MRREEQAGAREENRREEQAWAREEDIKVKLEFEKRRGDDCEIRKGNSLKPSLRPR